MVVPASIALEWLAAGVLVTLAGALIRFRNWTFLLAGYDEQSVVPDDVVSQMAGMQAFGVGIATVVLGVIVFVSDPPTFLATVFSVVILIAVIRMIHQLNTYTAADA